LEARKAPLLVQLFQAREEAIRTSRICNLIEMSPLDKFCFKMTVNDI